jgi:hypothetical protein
MMFFHVTVKLTGKHRMKETERERERERGKKQKCVLLKFIAIITYPQLCDVNEFSRNVYLRGKQQKSSMR